LKCVLYEYSIVLPKMILAYFDLILANSNG